MPAQLQKHLGKVLASFLVRQLTRCSALAVKIDQVEVESTVSVAVAYHAIHQNRKVDPLNPFVVGARRMEGDVGAALRAALIGLLLPGVRLARRQLEGLVGVALNEANNRFTDHLQAIEI